MKEVLMLAAERRQRAGTHDSRRLRAAGRVPAIVYGHKQDPVAITVNGDELKRALRHHTRMLDLKIEQDTERVLLSEVQYDVYGTAPVHADFIRVAMDEVIRVEVPLVLHGRAKGEQHGGVTEQLITQIAVECLPADIPDEIPMVITDFEVGQSAHVSDLTAPAGVKIVTDPTYLVLTIAVPTKIAATEEVKVVEAEAEEPELIARGKEEGEEDDEDGKDK